MHFKPKISLLEDEVILEMAHNATDEEIDNATVAAYKMVFEAQKGWFITIHGYDDDPRGLYQIPEARTLCKRLVERGLISILHVSTMLDEAVVEKWGDSLLGAFEIWCLAEDIYQGNSTLDVTQELFGRFTKDLQQANMACDNLVKTKTQVKDGQNRTKLGF